MRKKMEQIDPTVLTFQNDDAFLACYEEYLGTLLNMPKKRG